VQRRVHGEDTPPMGLDQLTGELRTLAAAG